jgi:hypothetical protein
MLYREIITVCSEITQYINTLCGQNVEFVNIKPGGTCYNHYNYRSSPYRAVNFPSVIKTRQLMLCREIMAVCSEIHTKHNYSVWAERGIVEC